jgi:undecaprenyl-diphosphatase
MTGTTGVVDVATDAANSRPMGWLARAGHTLSATAPGQDVEPGLIIDLPVVTPPPTISTTSLLWLGLGAGALSAALTATVAAHPAALLSVDDQVHGWVLAHRGGGSIALARAVTWGGVTYITLPVLIVVGAAARKHATGRSRVGAGVVLAGVASLGVYLGLALNSWVGRARPPITDWLGTAGGPAFPSGHTTAATLFAVSCAWALAPRVRPGWPRAALWLSAGVYAGLVGWSRVWLGVHWPSDVLGGWLGALAFAALAAAAVTEVRRRRLTSPEVGTSRPCLTPGQ